MTPSECSVIVYLCCHVALWLLLATLVAMLLWRRDR